MSASKDIDWANIGFKFRPTNGHVQYTWKDGKWGQAEWIKEPFLNIHICATGIQYGQGAFEGLKVYRAKDGTVRIFRPDENALRLAHSASIMSMPIVPESMFLEACEKVVAKNMEFVPPHGLGAAMYLRPLLLGTNAELGLSPAPEYTFILFGTPVGPYYKTGVNAVDAWIIDDFDRAAPLGTGSAKIPGNYGPVLRHTKKAVEKGYAITLHLDSKNRKYIDEFSTSNFLAISYKPSHANGNGIGNGDSDAWKPTLIVPQSVSILKSVTTKCIVGIAKDTFGWNVEIREVAFEEVKEGKFDEVAACGTAAIITPVKCISYQDNAEVHKIEIGDGKSAGQCFLRLYKELRAIQDGDADDQYGWLWPKTGIEPSGSVG